MRTSKPKKNVVATAVRFELNEQSGDVHLVFKVVDEGFKKRIREEWHNHIPLKLVGKDLVEE